MTGTISPIYVNVGCGAIHHPRWLNLDVEPIDPAITPLDVRKGIPLTDGAAAACFSSHVIEHLSPDAARAFLREQWRVLRSGGIIRVVCPDLAEIAREYLAEHDRAMIGNLPTFQHEHYVAELVDQMVRTEPGGQLTQLWRKATPAELEWVARRVGYVSEHAIQSQGHRTGPRFGKVLNAVGSRAGRYRLWRRLCDSYALTFARVLGGAKLAQMVKVAIFRESGEGHRWMYDAVTLSATLASAGFVDTNRKSLGESDIPEWASFGLEFREGRQLKPHSLVIEARKP